jgi:AcrR family transcriptional regulator
MPKRGELSKERILDAALRLADSDGVEALTMRRIADEIGSSPMSLYRHVESRDEILRGLVDRALEPVALDADPGAPWDEQLREIFTGVHRSLLEHPGLIAILATQSVSADRAMRAVESMLASLRAAGFTGDDSVAVVAALQSYTFGFTVQQRARSADDQRSHLETLRALPAGEYPQIHELAADFGAWTSQGRFEVGLDWLLAGIRQASAR